MANNEMFNVRVHLIWLNTPLMLHFHSNINFISRKMTFDILTSCVQSPNFT